AIERSRGAELLLTNKVVLDRSAIEQLPGLRYIGVLATGTNVVDMSAARSRGIVVTNVPGYATESVVAHVFGLILELEMRVSELSQAVHAGDWSRAPDFTFRRGSTLELATLTLGVVGLGNIGRRVAEVGRAFGMRVLGCSRIGSKRPLPSGVELTSMDELFEVADVITLHCPLVPETQHLVNARRLSTMKSTAILINTGRGALVDESALAAALSQERIRGAGLDVLSVEPPPAGHPLLLAPHCIVTPHSAWSTCAARLRLMQAVTSNVEAFLAGAPTNMVS
ncbi:MAG TPA: D-2-hydroxyacid dehydrogenase, partial [Polyangiaceae bacterium]|nr:D-2-hydroxyacid dehydrogenase [Polyangiaceae bacterium]